MLKMSLKNIFSYVMAGQANISTIMFVTFMKEMGGGGGLQNFDRKYFRTEIFC
jgi:hypothetical protein